MDVPAKPPTRTIRRVLFEPPIGPLTIETLLAMPEDQWGFLRDQITDRRQQRPNEPLARCGRCGSGVFIRVDALHTRRPLFAHFKHPLLQCEWHHETPSVDDVRAIQYMGQQEGDLHRSLCNTLADLLRADPRCREVTVGTYRPPTEGQHGRYPDVYAELEGVTPVALEVQLSRSFAPEIAGRTLFYGKENVGLIWVLWGVDPNDPELPQSFRDIIRRHRGNAFLFNDEAMKASQKDKTLLLSCHWRKADGSPAKPRLVRLDDLTFPDRGLPYFDDRRSRALLQQGTDARLRWWQAAKAKPEQWYSRDRETAFFSPAWDSLRYHVPDIRDYRDALRKEGYDRGHIAAVIFRLLSIVRTAHDGEQRNLATRESGKNAVVAMLNTALHSSEYARYGKLFRSLITLTAARKLLTAESLWGHINTACATVRQIDEDHPMWRGAQWLFPEALDPLVRHELDSLGSLPDWAQPD
jgi:hypothetical protein